MEAILIPLGFFAMIVAVVAINVLANLWNKGRDTMALVRLKELMISRGMSVDEIERVLAAGSDKPLPKTPRNTASPPPKPYPVPLDWPVHSKN